MREIFIKANKLSSSELSRRDFVKFVGGASALSLSGCASFLKGGPGFTPISPSMADDVLLASGFQYKVLIGWGDAINRRDTFGYNNDYTAFIPLTSKPNEAILWVNHEYPSPMFLSGYLGGRGMKRTRAQVDNERYALGGSLLHIAKDKKGRWQVQQDSEYNRRITGATKIPLNSARPIAGKSVVEGTMGNCAGGVTPWGTILTCEENIEAYYGTQKYGESKVKPSPLGWEKFYDGHPHHYGWVVEVNPLTGEAKKQIGLGRFAHECATVTRAKDGRIVVYSGDDKKNEFVYKFISNSKDNIDEGELFVANMEKGEWTSLDIEKQPILKKYFKDQTEVLIHCRKAGDLVGATKCDRPEDIEINPNRDGEVFICLTNNYSKRNLADPKNNFYGSILKICEEGGDHGSMKFSSSDFVVGGEELGLACPDNLTFDRKGNLWVSTDISGDMIGKGPYEKFGNNGLFYIPLSGSEAGKAFQVASAPVDAEFTGISFAPDGKTLFLSVQHPGENSPSLDKLRSHWPDGGESRPRSAVIQIHGPMLDRLTS